MPKTISIANQKGGVGKTTTAINLACALSLSGKRSLIVDLDPQANATSGLSATFPTCDPLQYYLLRPDNAKALIQYPKIPGPALMPSFPQLVNLEQEMLKSSRPDHHLATALRQLPETFDFILIDCPPSLGILTANSLTASDSVLIPIQCEYFAMEGLSKILGLLRNVAAQRNQPLKIEGVLLTMFSSAEPLNIEVEAEVREYFGAATYDTVIPRDSALAEAPSHGASVFEYAPTSCAAYSYMRLCQEVQSASQKNTR